MPPLLFVVPPAAIPPINVTVEAPPGLPTWEPTVISAVVGTFFGVASSIVMEFIKPYVAKMLLRKTAIKHLNEEFLGNYASILELIDILDDAIAGNRQGKRARALLVLDSFRRGMTTDRLDFYRQSQMTLFYEIDEGHYLGKFYSLCTTALDHYLATQDNMKASDLLRLSSDVAKTYSQIHRLPTAPKTDNLMRMYEMPY